MTERRMYQYRSALKLLETLLIPGGKALVSPYLEQLELGSRRALVPVYQSLFIDVLRSGFLPSDLAIYDYNSPDGVGHILLTDALLAWETACSIMDIKSGLENVELLAPASGEISVAYKNALSKRINPTSTPEEVGMALGWLEERGKLSTDRPPNFLILTWPWPDPDMDNINHLLDLLPEGGIVAAVTWRERGVSPDSLFAWRHELLQERKDFVSLGPCGQEYGRELPEACQGCNHGRSAWVHTLWGKPNVVIQWSYALLIKREQPIECPDHALISAADFDSSESIDLQVRYVGSIREKESVHDHPDSFNDDPSDERWHEYLRLCPGKSGLQKLAVDGRAGMALSRMRYGQWLPLNGARTKRPYKTAPDFGIIQLPNETTLHHFEQLPVDETFLPVYKKASIDEVAYRLFGFPELWPFQHTVLERVLLGKDIFAIAATGGGKSECYILPAMLLPGVTIVISPLKSLMQDQFEQRIRDRYGLDHLTTFINGDVSFYKRQGRLRRMALGHYKLVYVTPEQLERGYVLEAIRQTTETVGVRYLALDEAHCISQWGHDFRPSYLNIVERLADYGIHPHKIALTATASPLVRDDVCQELHLDKRPIQHGGDVYIHSANRPELNLVVQRTKSAVEKSQIIVKALQNLKSGSAIVFMPHTGGPLDKPKDFGAPVGYAKLAYAGMVSTGVSAFVRFLQKQIAEPIAVYYGKMENDSATDTQDEDVITRQSEQRAFMSGEKRIMIATKGFGMGIDKPDIRLVIHRTPPGNLEAYAQEAGRAGRDRKPATVLLLYSEDNPQIEKVSDEFFVRPGKRIQSDEAIQSFFIEQRYVRRMDVEAMVAFLTGDFPKKMNGRLYFTNDQVMKVFDACRERPEVLGLAQPYAWPKFPPRQSWSYESRDHKAILDTGHLYSKKREHIGRILKVIYNNRPSLDGVIVPLIRMAHESGTILRRFSLYKPYQILESPAYFGVRLREAGITEAELRSLLPRGDRVDIAPLAERLEISLRETASMLYDIRSSQGRMRENDYGRNEWKGTLLDFKRIEAPRWVDLTDPYDRPEWRTYAGAYKRAKPWRKKELDDYFPEWTLNKPLGWEVTPGEGLSYPDAKVYLNAFMALHDERRKNDVANFDFLVNRYIGADGKEQTCLRSLLLGYLKTGETIVGGNCKGCSVCVPDLNFERYTMTQRRSVVVFLMPETLDLLQWIEDSNRQAPPLDTAQKVSAALEAENQQGRDATTYLESWLTRLIQDDPEHQGALWLRIWANEEGFLPSSQSDFVTAIVRLTKSTTSSEHLTKLWEIIEEVLEDRAFKSYRKELLRSAAQIASVRQSWEDEATILEQVKKIRGIRRQEKRDVLVRLIHLYQDYLDDTIEASESATKLLSMRSYSAQEARIAYQVLVKLWDWRDVEAELTSGHRYALEGLLLWLEDNDAAQNRQKIVDWISEHPDKLVAWPETKISQLMQLLEPEINQHPQALLILADRLQASTITEEKEIADLLLRAWAAGASLSQPQISMLAVQLTELDEKTSRERLAARPDSAALMISLWKINSSITLLFQWLHVFPPEILSGVSDDLFDTIWEIYLASENPDLALLPAFARRFSMMPEAEQEQLLAALAKRHPSLAVALFESLWQEARLLSDDLVEVLFPLVLNGSIPDGKAIQLLERLSTSSAQLSIETLSSKCLEIWQVLKRSKGLISLVMQYRPEGRTLVTFTRRWSAYQKKLYLIDMLVIILEDVRRRSSRNWLTPVSLELQTLCKAGRFAEAQEIANSYPQMSIRPAGLKSADYVTEMRKKRTERSCEHDVEYLRLWKLFQQMLGSGQEVGMTAVNRRT